MSLAGRREAGGGLVGRNKRSALRRFISNTAAEVAVSRRRPPVAPERRNALRLLRPTVLNPGFSPSGTLGAERIARGR